MKRRVHIVTATIFQFSPNYHEKINEQVKDEVD